jgi:rubrerythrin
MDQTNAMPLDRDGFLEVVRHPLVHALVLENYRLGEYAGVVVLDRLLREMHPEGKLRRAMTIHHGDEERHSRVFTDWIERLGQTPQPYPTNVETFFANSPEERAQHVAFIEQLPRDHRRIITLAGINAIERLAYNQFEVHLSCLDRREDRAVLQSVIDEEKFHLSYVEHELEKQSSGENGAFVTMALEQAQARFAIFQGTRRAETMRALARLLGGGTC